MRVLELFSGTGSIGRAFERHGWEVISLDLDSKSGATIIGDFMKWDWTVYEPGYFQCVWSSPPCTAYSCARTTGKLPRDLEGSDRLVARVLECIAYFRPVTWWLENPGTGLLKTRAVVQGLPYHDTSYCVYGFLYKKFTRIWTNSSVELIPCCCHARPCEYFRQHRHHAQTAQRGPSRYMGVLKENDRCSLNQLHSMPPALCDAIAQEATRALRA